MKSINQTLLFLLILLFCFSAQAKDQSYPPMIFKVDEARLGAEFVSFDSSFNISCPQNYISLPDSLMKALRTNPQIGREGSLLKFFPRQILVDPENPRTQVIISNLTATINSYHEVVNIYDQEYLELYQEAETDRFTINGIRCWQGRRLFQDEVRFRLLLDCGKPGPVQVDLINPVDSEDPQAFENLSKKIESIIGSIHARN